MSFGRGSRRLFTLLLLADRKFWTGECLLAALACRKVIEVGIHEL